MIIYLTLGVLISLVLRYVLVWDGRLVQYGQFTCLWIMILLGLWTIDGFAQPSPIHAIASTLAMQCKNNESACILRARLALAEGALDDVKQYLLNVKSNEAQQLMLYIRLHSNSDQSVLEDVNSWLALYPEDIMLREAYIEALVKRGDIHQAMKEYSMVKDNSERKRLLEDQIAEIIEGAIE